MLNEENAGLNVDTATTTDEESSTIPNANGETEHGSTTETETKTAEDNGQPTTKTFTQEELNKIVQDRLSRESKSFLKKFGVESEEDIKSALEKSKSVDSLSEQIKTLQKELALTSNNIREDKREDVEFYFKGKGLDLNSENLKNELETHKEWLNATKTIETLGTKGQEDKTEMSEEEYAQKLFGMEFH